MKNREVNPIQTWVFLVFEDWRGVRVSPPPPPTLLISENIKAINVKKILAVLNATYAVAKRKPEKIRLAAIRIPASLIFSGFLFATA